MRKPFFLFACIVLLTNSVVVLQGAILEGHALKLELCHVKKGPSDGTPSSKLDKEKSSTKLIVRNIAFEATKADLKQLFSTFGQVIFITLTFILQKTILFMKLHMYVTLISWNHSKACLSS